MKRSKIAGIIGTILLHIAVLLLLLFYILTPPQPEDEGGVPVVLGDMQAHGDADPYEMTEVDMLPQEEMPEREEVSPQPEEEAPVITQKEESVVKVKESPRKEVSEAVKKPKEKTSEKKEEKKDKPKEQTEAEKKAEAERAAAAAAASKIAGAFGKGSKMGNKGNTDSGAGVEGSPTGNSNTGKTSGTGGTGTFDLNGRSLGEGGLPVPEYNVQDEGRVVVTIIVDPEGRVVSANINKRTNTVNPALRRSALNAARKARFNAVSSIGNQSGTITYYFKLK